MKKDIFKRIAKKYGVSISEVRRDMEEVLNKTFENPVIGSRYPDFNGKKPTLEEFISSVSRRVKNEM